MAEKPIHVALLEAGCISHEQLQVAYREQKATHERLETVLERLGFVSPRDVLDLMGRTYNAPLVDFADAWVDSRTARRIPEELARAHKVLPIEARNGTLVLAMVDVNDIVAIDKVREITGCHVEPRIADEVELQDVMDEVYGLVAASEHNIEECVRQALRVDDGDQEAAPIIRLVDLILTQAIKDRATDVHLEADTDVGRVRCRIDGVLHMSTSLPKKVYLAAVSRIKVMGGMDITNNRIPHDGGIGFALGSRKVDMRVSTMPGAYGESAVVRILEKPRFILSLEQMGFTGGNLEVFRRLVEKPYGMIVVTGPTGAGKSTTLYGALRMMNALEKSIITVEDPIEYRMPLIKQTQVNHKAGYTFATSLRAILRHDPDIILIGEMRDLETAEIAMKAAMTGHLLFTTLHANTASAAIPRLIDMGIEPFIVASSVLAVCGQRLVRRICTNCKTPYDPAPDEFPEWFPAEHRRGTFHRGTGCDDCRNTGYRGRTGVFELLEVTPEVSTAVARRITPVELEAIARIRGMREDGIEKIVSGVTTLAEIRRVLG